MDCGCYKELESLIRKINESNVPKECIPVDKIKPNLQNKYCFSDSFVDDTNQLLQMYHGESVHYYLIFILQLGYFFS